MGACGKCGHRERCQSRELLPNGMCVECICVVCDAMRNGGQFCKKHKNYVKKMSWPLQLTALTRDFVEDLIPCDVTDFLSQSEAHLYDLTALETLAFVKIAIANTRWNRSVDTRSCTAQAYADSLLAIAAISERAELSPSCADYFNLYKSQWQQLNRQGVGRFTGLPVWCSSLKHVKSLKKATPTC